MLEMLSALLAREKLLRVRGREIAALRAEVERLRTQNEKLHRAMRRCLSCDYRLQVLSSE